MLIALGLLLPALGLLALSLLTWMRVPVAIPWQSTVLAGEYGHVFAGVSAVLLVLVWFLRGKLGWLAVPELLICMVAIICFLRPVVSAMRIAQTLPERMSTVWGAPAEERPVFSVASLFSSRARPVSVTTYEFAPELKLDYRAAVGREQASPCVVLIHGGGWDSGDRTELAFFNDWLAHEGYAVAAVDYRLAPEHPWPAQHADVLAALDWLKAHAAELGIDPQRFVLMGRSAGGQIATAVGYAAHDPAIRGVVSLYAPQDMEFVWSISRSDDALNSKKLMLQYMTGPPDTLEQKERYRSASAQMQVERGTTPPTLLMHGELDTLVWYRHSERLAARLQEAEIAHVFVTLPWACHAFEYNSAGPSGQITAYAVRRFLGAVTK